jgi:hypothetical protein
MGKNHGILHDLKWIFHGVLDFASSPPQRHGSGTKPQDLDTPSSEFHNPWFIMTYLMKKAHRVDKTIMK